MIRLRSKVSNKFLFGIYICDSRWVGASPVMNLTGAEYMCFFFMNLPGAVLSFFTVVLLYIVR